MEPRTRFIFRGEAVAIAGDIRRPRRLRIPAQCSVALPTIGGTARIRLSNGKFGDIVSYRSAMASVEGDYCEAGGKGAVDFTYGNHSENNLPTRTRVSTLVRGLVVRVAGRTTSRTLKAVSVGATLVSEHPGTRNEPSIQTERIELSGFAIDGYPVEVTFHDLFARYPTRESLAESFQNEKVRFDAFDRCLFTRPGYRPPKGRRALPEEGGILFGTVVKEIAWARKPHLEATIEGNRIRVHGLGTISLGEIFITSYERRLTMMRIEIGCPVGGEVDVGDLSGDGHLWPP
jgi:hypothetical protein